MNKRTVILIALGLVLVIGAYAAYLYFGQQTSTSTLTGTEKAALDSGEGKSYEDLSEKELEARAKDKTGYTIDELKKVTINTSSLSSFEQADAAAKALLAAGDSSKSLEAYKVAEESAQGSQKTAEFYLEYQLAADAAGDYDAGTEAVKQQLAWYKQLANDPAAPQQIAILEQRLEVREQEKAQRGS